MKQLVISVHGIRTFGNWQERLEKLLEARAANPYLRVINYKYGYFSILAFLVPFLRWLVVRQFRKYYVDVATGQDWDRIDLVGHSFGTHIIAWALLGIDSAARPEVNTIVLAGSVLKSGFPWQQLIGRSVSRVVNDCGTKDTILIWNQICVLGTGMAGRLGFTGGIGKTFRNRFFKCGHSGYFLTADKPDDKFMREYWIPLLLTDAEPMLVDEREGGELSGIALWLLNNAEPIKIAAYATPLLLISIYFAHLTKSARTAQAIAEAERRRAEEGLVTTQRMFSQLGDLVAEKLRPYARLDDVDAELSHAEDVIRETQRTDPRIALPYAGVLLTRAELKGQARSNDEMRALAKRAIDILATNNKSIPEVQNLLGRANGLIGASYAGTAANRDTASRYYQAALAQLEPLEKQFDQTTSDEKSWTWLRSLALVQRETGDLQLNQFADVDAAKKYFDQSIHTWAKLKRLRPNAPEVAYELSWSQNKLGDVLQAQGEDDLALGSYERAERGLKPIAEHFSVDQWKLAVAQSNVGFIRRALGNYDQALSAFRNAADNYDTLLKYDPNQSAWLGAKAWTYNNMGETRMRWARSKGDAGLLDKGGDELKTALGLRAQLVLAHPDDARGSITPAITRANIYAYEGTEKELAGNCEGAAELFERAAEVNPDPIGDDRDDEQVLRSVEFREWAGLAYRNAGNKIQAEYELREALKIVNEQQPKFSGYRKAFAAIRQRLEQEVPGSALSKTAGCLP